MGLYDGNVVKATVVTLIMSFILSESICLLLIDLQLFNKIFSFIKSNMSVIVQPYTVTRTFETSPRLIVVFGPK